MKKLLLAVLGGAVVLGFGFSTGVHAQVAATLPSVPTGVSASSNVSSQISVSWSGSTESSGTIEGYYVYRNGGQIATTAGTSFTDTGISSGLYNYTVAAYDANGNVSAQSLPASITFIVDKTPPSVPTGVTIAGVTSTNSYAASTTLTISWNASTDNVGVQGYNIYRNGVQINATSSPYGATSITDTVLPGEYTYEVDAYDAAQNFSDDSAPVSVNVYVDTILPTVPTGVTAQQTSASGTTITWTSSTDSVGIAGYQIFRNGTQIATVTGSPYADTDLSLDASYRYAVAAYDNAGNISGQSYPVAQVTIQPDNGPSVPSILSATLEGGSSVQISWAIADDSLPITAYNIYRDGTQIASVTSTSYLDQDLATGTYAYSLSATDSAGAVSATSSATTIVVPTPSSIVTPPTVNNGTSDIGVQVFTQSLYAGLRSAQVQALQTFLIGQGYLPAADATGFFGNLTLHAVEQFQCAQNIVCTGGGGWGMVGPKTRAALNELDEAGTPNAESTSVTATATSTAAMTAEVQMLQAELANLEKQL